jgi:hypothetical protein
MSLQQGNVRFTRVIVKDRGRFVVFYERRSVGCEWKYPGGKLAPG